MMRLSAAQAISLLVGSLVFAGQFGCAHTPTRPASVSEAVRSQLGTIGVVVQPTAQEAIFHAPDTGMGANARRGAGLGAAQSGYAFMNPAGILVFPLVLPSFAMIGAVYGAAVSEPTSQWKEAESAFRAILEEMAVAKTVPNQLVPYAQQHGFDVHVIPLHTPQDHSADSQYAALAREGIDTVLELGELRISLAPAVFMVNPPRRLFMSAHTRLIRTADSAILDDRTVLDELAGTRSLNTWTVGHAQAFREEVGQAADRLAKHIIEELFWRDPPPEQCKGSSRFFGFLRSLCFVGPKPLYPLPTSTNLIPEVQALQPILRWEPSPASDVTYDLMIWRAEGLDTGLLVHAIWSADWLKPGVLVYSRERLAESSHRLEASLQPGTTYLWTVRAQFSSDGRIRVTPWGTQRETYFAFRTPANLR